MKLTTTPCTGKDFVYRPQTNGFSLYSVGPDGVDDGGKLLARVKNPGDLLKGNITLGLN